MSSHPTLVFHLLTKNQDKVHKNIKTIVHRRNLSGTNSVQSNRERVVIARWSWLSVTVVEDGGGIGGAGSATTSGASGRDGNGSGGPSE